MKKRLIIGLASWMASIGIITSSAHAASIVCSAQLIRTACGSGKIKISLDSTTTKFQIHIGDIQCWMGDFIISGEAKKIGSSYPYFLDNTYDLGSEFPEEQKKGKLFYDPALNVAKLEFFTRSYNLICESIPQNPDANNRMPEALLLELGASNSTHNSDDNCMAECGRSCLEKPIFCGQW